MRQHQFAHVVQTLLQHGAACRRRYVLVRNQQFGEYDRRHETALPYRVGAEEENTVACSEHHLSLRSIGRSRLAEAHTEGNGLVAVVLEPFVRRHKLADAVLGTHPEVARSVFTDGQQHVRRQTVFHTVRLEPRLSPPVERQQFVQSAAKGSQIQFVLPGRDNPVHIVVAQAVLVLRDALEVMEHRLLGRLETVLHDQSAQRSTNPDVAPTVARDEARLVTVVYGIAFQVVAVIHEHFPAAFVTRQVIDSPTEGGHPDAAPFVLIDTIYIVVAQAVNVVLAVTVARQAVLSAVRFSLDKAVTLGRYPQAALAVLQQEIDIAFHRLPGGRHAAGLGQISLVRPVEVIYPQLAVFQSHPQVVVAVLADGTHLVAQRLVTVRNRSKQAELRRTEGHLLQTLGVGTHPQIALTVGKSGMYLVGEAPAAVGQTVVERPQAVGLPVETRESAAIRMHPHRSIYILVNVESRTRTVGTGRFYRNNFGLQPAGLRIEVNNRTRHFLFEPDFSRPVTIGRQHKCSREMRSVIVRLLSRRQIADEETVTGSDQQHVISLQTVNRDYPRRNGKLQQAELPARLPVSPYTSVIRAEKHLLPRLATGIERLLFRSILLCRPGKIKHRRPAARRQQAQPVVRQQPFVSGIVATDIVQPNGRKVFRTHLIPLSRQTVCSRIGADPDGSFLFGKQPHDAAGQRLDGTHVAGTSFFLH